MKISNNGVTKPKGFFASGISSGIKRSGKKDLALIYSTKLASCFGVFTNNKIVAAPLKVTQTHLKDHKAQAIIINSGNANCFTRKQGFKDAVLITKMVAKNLQISSKDVLVASTGIIGKRLPVDKIKKAVFLLVKKLSTTGSRDANLAIMTTDKITKGIAASFKIGAKTVNIGAIAKGAGMIYPHLVSRHATMLCFITTDVNISPPALKTALVTAVNQSFNCISVDGCTSTNDMVLILANGSANNPMLKINTNGFARLQNALNFVCLYLAKKIVEDAEGATKFIQIEIKGGRSYSEAKTAGFAIANSSLFKTACYGNDPNWGRIVAALGSSGVNIDENRLNIKFSSFRKKNIKVIVNLNQGNKTATVYTSDLSPEYIRINAAYN